MLVISENQFTKDTTKYLRLAKIQKVVIKTGDTELELGKKKRMITEEDIEKALTSEELLEKVIPRIEQMYNK